MRDMDIEDGRVTAAMRDGVPDGPDEPTCEGCALWHSYDGYAGICGASFERLPKGNPDVLAECITYDTTPACGQWEEIR